MTRIRESFREPARRIAPFCGACLLAWVVVLVGSKITWWEYWGSFVLAWTAGGVAFAALVDRRYPWVAAVPSAILLLAAVGLLRDAAGGGASGVGGLAVLPVFQTALYSRSRRDLMIVLGGVALFYLVPIWVVGMPAYPATQYRTVLLGLAVDGIIGLTTQQLVARIRGQAREARARERMLEQVSAVVHGLFDSAQPREDVCEAIMSISSAVSAVLYEPLGDSDQLVCTATAGIDTDLDNVLVRRGSAAYRAMEFRHPVLITENVEAHVGIMDVWIAAGRPTSLLYQPLLRDDDALGVLVVAWPDHVRAQGPRATMVSLLVHEAAAVIFRADAMDHLSDEALTDALTGLPNRRAWDRHLRRLAAAHQRVAIGMLDLDHFKQFNDTYGHPAGDQLLKQTAAAWRDQLRPGDVLARIGGEEFGLLLLDRDVSGATEVVDRLRAHVTHDRTCSAGIAILAAGEALEAAIARTDAALYEAKAGGRDQTCVARSTRDPDQADATDIAVS